MFTLALLLASEDLTDSGAIALADTTVEEVRAAHTRGTELADDEQVADCVAPLQEELSRLERGAETAWSGLHGALHDGSETRRHLAIQRLGAARVRAQQVEGLALACLVTEEGTHVEEPLLPPLQADEPEPVSVY